MAMNGSLLEELQLEIDGAQCKFGPFTSTHEGYGVLAEEVSELLDAVRRNDRAAVRAETIQVAAVALRIAQSCDEHLNFQRRSGFKWP